MKTEDEDYVKKNVTANVINSEEVNFLCGRETTKGQKIRVNMEDPNQNLKSKRRL